ncbi:hypothetical protein COO60DRAFT_50386 [Scenedesmus sp. NREL 46B-D3]|nr:hypothetical protein COO60DRAFT_50386 [Scenedesmus sp. NREL 46B-D3]
MLACIVILFHQPCCRCSAITQAVLLRPRRRRLPMPPGAAPDPLNQAAPALRHAKPALLLKLPPPGSRLAALAAGMPLPLKPATTNLPASVAAKVRPKRLTCPTMPPGSAPAPHSQAAHVPRHAALTTLPRLAPPCSRLAAMAAGSPQFPKSTTT